MTADIEEMAALLDKVLANYPQLSGRSPLWTLTHSGDGWRVECCRVGENGPFPTAAQAVRHAIDSHVDLQQKGTADLERRAKESRDLTANIERIVKTGI